MLNSSPVSLPRPLKRSASVASLPTPPRTRHKRKRGGSKHSSRASSDEDLTATDDDEDDAETHEKLIKEAEEEESFWLSTNNAQQQSPSTGKSAASAPLLYRRLQTAQSQVQVVEPVSPPPSHRKPPARTAALAVPRTPTPKSASTLSPSATPKRGDALRDSPDNPFLASPLGSQDEVVVNESDGSPTLQEEKPTMAFVFRGVRRSFPNPYYDPASTAPTPTPNSQLPPEHPDFEPDERSVRKLLFGVKRNTKAKGGARSKTSSSNGSTKPRRLGGTGRERGRQGRPAATAAASSSEEL
ncbi:hypothetical protein R3P38DRAFT_2994045 [Favolaschia claudopus]|uniref:Uncharacterized protein n=1 Tax=Favolaschia claudopus TaxID=2862362 RepID=A0AAW0AT59_9AGAR